MIERGNGRGAASLYQQRCELRVADGRAPGTGHGCDAAGDGALPDPMCGSIRVNKEANSR